MVWRDRAQKCTVEVHPESYGRCIASRSQVRKHVDRAARLDDLKLLVNEETTRVAACKALRATSLKLCPV